MEQPNVILLTTHDTGRRLEPFGVPVPTPHFTRLAQEGVVFERAFCSAPQCSPSRGSLLTGLVPHRHGLIGLTHLGFRLAPTALRQTLPALLATAGYDTHLVGFQHEAPDPHQLGYRRVVTIPGDHGGDVAAAVAQVLRGGPTQPFFLAAGFAETHRPYRPSATPLDHIQVPPYLPDTPVVRRDLADLDGAVRDADAGLGVILAALDQTGLAAATLLIYTPDHGIAFPRAKGTLFDPGLEIGLIVRGPTPFSGGRRLRALVSNVDVLPTVLEWCGLRPPGGLQGRSLLPLVAGRVARVRDAIYAELTYHTAYDPMRAVRTARHKYIRSFAERPLNLPAHVDPGPTKDLLRDRGFFAARRPREMLFDLTRDPWEHHNVIADPAYADVGDALRRRLEQWMTATRDPVLRGDVPAPPGAHVTPVDAYDPV